MSDQTPKSVQVSSRSDDLWAEILDFANPQITEKQFINEFLKLMLDPDLTEEVQVAHNTRWLNYAKSVFTALDVTRDGKVIFTVPPLCDPESNVLKQEGQSDSFRLLLRTVKEQKEIHDHFGTNILNEYIGNYAPNKATISPKIAASWRHILDFYGITTEVVKRHTGNDLVDSAVSVSVTTPNYGDNVDLDEDC